MFPQRKHISARLKEYETYFKINDLDISNHHSEQKHFRIKDLHIISHY